MNFEKLADETMKLCEEIGQSSFEEQKLKFNIDGLDDQDIKETAPELVRQKDDSTGIFFRVELGSNTFCIRAIAVTSLDDAISGLENGNKDLLRRLKIDSYDVLESLQFFETDSEDDGKRVVRQVANRRFPYHEELLCNLSDPGLNWWMDIGDRDFQIYFTTNRIDREFDLINLGPIGDAKMVAAKFKAVAVVVNKLFQVEEFSFSDKFLTTVAVDGLDPLYVSFVNIFRYGQFEHSLRDEIIELGGYELCEFLHNLALVRKFWIEITEHHLNY